MTEMSDCRVASIAKYSVITTVNRVIDAHLLSVPTTNFAIALSKTFILFESKSIPFEHLILHRSPFIGCDSIGIMLAFGMVMSSRPLAGFLTIVVVPSLLRSTSVFKLLLHGRSTKRAVARLPTICPAADGT